MTAQKEISELREKFKDLINLYERTKHEKSELLSKVDQLNQELDACKNDLVQTESELEVLKIAKSVTGSTEDTHDAKIKINRIVREIDKCIASMNR